MVVEPLGCGEQVADEDLAHRFIDFPMGYQVDTLSDILDERAAHADAEEEDLQRLRSDGEVAQVAAVEGLQGYLWDMVYKVFTGPLGITFGEAMYALQAVVNQHRGALVRLLDLFPFPPSSGPIEVDGAVELLIDRWRA